MEQYKILVSEEYHQDLQKKNCPNLSSHLCKKKLGAPTLIQRSRTRTCLYSVYSFATPSRYKQSSQQEYITPQC